MKHLFFLPTLFPGVGWIGAQAGTRVGGLWGDIRTRGREFLVCGNSVGLRVPKPKVRMESGLRYLILDKRNLFLVPFQKQSL